MNIEKVLRLIASGKSLEQIASEIASSKDQIIQTLLSLADQYSHKQDISIFGKINQDGILKVYIDGAVSGNPGIGGIGCVVFNSNDQEIARASRFIGTVTNNVAEYKALLFGIELTHYFSNVKYVYFFTDSELLAKQISGKYKVSHPNMLKYYNEFLKQIKDFCSYTVKHIPRDKNKLADELACRAKNSKI